MKAKTKRLWIVIIWGICIFAAAGIIMTVFRDNLVFFYDPTQLKTLDISENKKIRIGGLVEENSVNKNELLTEFRLTDLKSSIQVRYSGILPPMFREGQGIVAEGKMKNGVFIAENLLTKHDEKYMPPEIADSLKKSGQWKGEQ